MRKKLLKGVLPALLLLLGTLSLLLRSSAAASGAGEGIALCIRSVIPSLFPFFVVSSAAVSMGYAEKISGRAEGFMEKLFCLPGACALPLTLSLISGSPAGVRSVGEMYRRGEIEKSHAERLLGFCNNCSPGFIIGMVGAGILGSVSAGIYLYAIHILSSLAFGAISALFCKDAPIRKGNRTHEKRKPPEPAAAFTDAVTSSWGAVLSVCAFVVFFSVVTALLKDLGAPQLCADCLSRTFGFDRGAVLSLFTGFFEMTAGVSSISGGDLRLRLILCSLILGWSGLSSLCQAAAVAESAGLSAKNCLRGKAFQGLFSAAATIITCPLLTERISDAFMPIAGGMTSGLSLPFSLFLMGILFAWTALIAVLAR